MNVGTHRSHCCIRHGCKYGNSECPVEAGTVKQDGPCQMGVDLEEPCVTPSNSRGGRALLIVDCQVDFCEGGSLAVAGGNAVAKRIGTFLRDWQDYDYIAASLDWHNAPPDTNAGHFALDGEPDFVRSWPVHCVAQSHGSDLHPEIDQWVDVMSDLVRKGRGCQSYSAFEGVTWDGQRTLLAALRTREITVLDVCGLATDYCVKASVLDALSLGFEVHVLTDLCAAVNADPKDGVRALIDMQTKGAILE